MVREKAEIRFPEKLEIRIIRDEQKRTKPNVKFKESKDKKKVSLVRCRLMSQAGITSWLNHYV